MAQREEFRRIGHWLFRWRSFLPLLTIPIFLVALKGSNYHGGSDLSDIAWEAFGFALCFLGLGIRVYTIGHAPKGTSGRITKGQKAEVLNTTGVYSVVRHPLYLGNFLIWLGITSFVGSLVFSLAAILLFFLYYEPIVLVEEEFLRGKFGQAFLGWAKQTPVLFPRFKNWRKPILPFSLKTVLRREYCTFFLITASLTSLEVTGDFFHKGRWQISPGYCVLFCFGLVVYIVLRTLRKKHILDVEGR